MSFKELTDAIVSQHHSLLRRELPQTSALISELLKQDPSITEAEKMFSKIRKKIEAHLFDEETVFFPTGAALETGGELPASEFNLLERLTEMEQEHDNCGNALIKVAQMLGERPESDLRNKVLTQLQIVSADLDVHVEKENNQVHPRLVDLLKSCSVK